MEEKKQIKVSLGTAICVFIIIILLLVIAGMYVYYNYTQKNNDNNNTVISNKIENKSDLETSTKNNYIKIDLSNEEKINKNKELSNKLLYIIRHISEDNLDNLEKNTNLLIFNEIKAQILWYAMYFDGVQFVPYDENGNVATGQATIDVDTANNYYKKIFDNTSDKNFQELLEAFNNMNFKVKNNKIYGVFPTGWGIDPFELKISSIEFNEQTNTYKEIINILKPDSNDENEIINMIEKYSDEKVLEWPDELNYAKLEIEYKKDLEDNKILTSLVFTK